MSAVNQERLFTKKTATLRLIRIETPPPQSNAEIRQLPLRLDIPHVPAPMNVFNSNPNMMQNSNIQSIPSFTFTQYEPMMMDHTPVSATSSVSFFDGEGQGQGQGQINTTQLPLSPILPASDFDLDALLGIDSDFDQLKFKLSMPGSSPDVQRALQRGNKLLQAGSALLPKTNIESMDVSRQENREAVGYYRAVLRQLSNGADATAIADSLRHISQIQANSSVPDLQPDESLADRERLLAGYHFLFGNDSTIYLRQVFEFCDKGRASTDPGRLNSQLSMFRTAVQKMLHMDLAIDRTESILGTVNTYFTKGLITQEELEYFFSSIIRHRPPKEWWKACENIRFVGQALLDRGFYDRAEPYLIIIMKDAHKHLLIGDFFNEDQYAWYMFSTLSSHICPGNVEYLSALGDLESDLRSRRRPSNFDCLELTCWILLATAYVSSLRPPEEVIFMLREAELETRQDRPAQKSWHFIDGITSALYALSRHLRTYMHEPGARYVSDLADSIGMRWAMPKLYAG